MAGRARSGVLLFMGIPKNRLIGPGAWVVCLACLMLCGCHSAASGGESDANEFKIKRQDVFEFTQKPQLWRNGDHFEISFAVKAFCDATIAIESSEEPGAAGKILRHLASGVLGPNAPAPFKKNALNQTVSWDGKDDRGIYIDNVDSLSVRVSLGLKASFDRSLFWEPHKRIANSPPLIQAAEEGVYVFEGKGVDHLRLFDHEGNYLRTIYPFPASTLDKVEGLSYQTFPQDGRKLPVKQGFVQATLLTSGTSAIFDLPYKFGDGFGGSALAVSRNGRIALAFQSLNRFATDGTSGGLKLQGPKTGILGKWNSYGGLGGGEEVIGPSSIAFSPDGKWLYLTGYTWREFYGSGGHCQHGVLKLAYDQDAEPVCFAGVMKDDGGEGTDNTHFKCPTSVACDSRGRVYVSDFMNDRIQVFSADGQFLQSVKTKKPAKIMINKKNDELWIGSFAVTGVSNKILKESGFEMKELKPTLTHLGPLENPTVLGSFALPVGGDSSGMFVKGQILELELDSWTTPPTLWLSARKHDISRIDAQYWGMGVMERRNGSANGDPWIKEGIQLITEKDGKLELKRSFGKDTAASVVRVKPPDFSRQRLYVNPKTELLYVGEDLGFGKSFKEMIEINPATGSINLTELPFDAEDICFDSEGLAYLRTDTLVARYDSKTWREVPWDYGEEREHVGFTAFGGGKKAPVISGLPTPGVRPVCWNQGGMSVSFNGDLIVSCCSRENPPSRKTAEMGNWERAHSGGEGRPYTPQIFPGRARWQEIHVWDKHGKLRWEDAVPGLTIVNGVELDRDGNIYVMAAANRILDGTPYFNEMAGTLMKVQPKHAKVVSTSQRAAVPLPPEALPKSAPQLAASHQGRAWVDGAEWFYGGVGFGGFNPSRAGGGCHCWNSKFALDYFARSFAPETDHYSLAVLDSNGNLLLRIGRYGNVDSAGSQSRVPLGGDEVGLFHPLYVATLTDRRLFISDPGNARIVSVNLDYHTSERLSLKSNK